MCRLRQPRGQPARGRPELAGRACSLPSLAPFVSSAPLVNPLLKKDLTIMFGERRSRISRIRSGGVLGAFACAGPFCHYCVAAANEGCQERPIVRAITSNCGSARTVISGTPINTTTLLGVLP